MKWFSIITIFCCNSLFSQLPYSRYWIQFTDKNNNPYSIAEPDSFLSPRAIARRTRYNIPIIENDLPITPMYIDSLRSIGVQILNRSKWFNAVTIQTTDSLLLDSIMNLAFVKKVDTVAAKTLKRKIDDIESSPSPLNSFKMLDVDYGVSLNQIEMVNGHLLHQQGLRGDGMVIAVLDAGFRDVNTLFAFDSLRAEGRLLGTWDFVAGDQSVFEDGPHGMWVLSVMAANLPGLLVGTAPKASYWLFRTEDGSSEYRIEEDNWVAAAEFADSVGADIINSSLGYSDEMTYPFMNHIFEEMDGNTTRVTIGADIAASKGILVVNSAGNEGGAPWNHINAPADGDSVLSVGAVDANGFYVSFSSPGPTYDGRIKPDITAQGAGNVMANTANGISTNSGTSFSSPIIAGMSACLWQAHPGKSNMEILKAIQQSATRADNPDNLTGYGIADFCDAHVLLSGECPKTLAPIETKLNVYGNPFGNSIKFDIGFVEKVSLKVQVFNIIGQKIYESTTEVAGTYVGEIDTDNWANGLYLLKITADGGNWIYKFVRGE